MKIWQTLITKTRPLHITNKETASTGKSIAITLETVKNESYETYFYTKFYFAFKSESK